MPTCESLSAICVAGTDDDDKKATDSNYGDLVGISAPFEVDVDYYALTSSTDVITTKVQGTSISAPLVSGAAYAVWDKYPNLTANQVKERLLKSADNIEDKLDAKYKGKMGAGRLDAFEAVFNGSFELADVSDAGAAQLPTWEVQGMCSAIKNSGIDSAYARSNEAYYDGEYVAWCDTTPTDSNDAFGVVADDKYNITFIKKPVKLHPEVETLPLSFDYNFVSEEYPRFIGSKYVDEFRVTLTPKVGEADGTCARSIDIADKADCELIRVNVNDSEMTLVDGKETIQARSLLLSQDVGHTGWQTACLQVPVGKGFDGTLQFELANYGDAALNSAIYIDNIQFACDTADNAPVTDHNNETSAYARVTSSGAVLQIEGSDAKIEIPAGAIAEGETHTFVIRIVPEPKNSNYDAVVDSTFKTASDHFEITTSAPSLLKPIRVTLPYDLAELPISDFDDKIDLRLATASIQTVDGQRQTLSPFAAVEKSDATSVDDTALTYSFLIDELNELDYFVIGYEVNDVEIDLVTTIRNQTYVSTKNGDVYASTATGKFTLVRNFGGQQLKHLAVGANSQHSMLIDGSGVIYGKGRNNSGQLGANSDAFSEPSYLPTHDRQYYKPARNCYHLGAGDAPATWKYVATGSLGTLAIDDNDEVYIWGSGQRHRLGTTSTHTIIKCPLKSVDMQGLGLQAMSMEHSHGAGISATGQVYTWGSNSFGALGRDSSSRAPELVNIPANTGDTIADVQTGWDLTVALQPDGSIWAWGSDHSGVLGNGEGRADKNLPTKVEFPLNDMGTVEPDDDVERKFIKISVGRAHVLALEDNGQVWAWGDSSSGQAGGSVGSVISSPQRLAWSDGTNINTASAIYAGSDFSLIYIGNQLYGIGSNLRGQLGGAAHTGVAFPSGTITIGSN
ncbi:S8 family serine peptidase [Cardiobacteriales bacterium ML27]|uniref:S8 family serine peptidase n=1 Tax=Ostreibacterium oceani TaxID=2654998 RepID=A0A6N7EZV0_9GAMM|nr:S8 family serine peptidase [Ostreibacterium oceani]